MAEVNITQAEADALLAMEKESVSDDRHDFPVGGVSLTIPLRSQDKREQFLLDISRGRIELKKGKFQNRARQVVVLLRLDFGGAPHCNPDGKVVACPHLHTYREGFGDKWAAQLPAEKFGDKRDTWRLLGDFMRLCNITKPPIIERGLFT